jgi:hypothetical protein
MHSNEIYCMNNNPLIFSIITNFFYFKNSKTLTIEAKSTNLSLIQNILEEFKSILTAS